MSDDTQWLTEIAKTIIPENKHIQELAVADVLSERSRQEEKWGEQNHDPFTYLTVLVEEVGEFAQAALHTLYGGRAADGLRKEAIHVAAVALAIVECLDRGKWRWPTIQNGQEER